MANPALKPHFSPEGYLAVLFDELEAPSAPEAGASAVAR